MRKLATLFLLALWVIPVVAIRGTAQDQDKTARWHGVILRSNKDESTFTVRRQNVDKTVQYDSSTKWTHLNKPAEMSEFKDGVDVICLGTYDDKGVLHASRIDLRRE